MRAGQRMGLFLRTWRSEWAGLTRAQLALAVSRAAGRNVAVPVIRAWEMGQAPGSTEELQALLEVMGRHGLQAFEVRQFRDAVLASCLDGHYPGLLADEEMASSPDLLEAARAIHGSLFRDGGASVDTVNVVAMMAELRQVIYGNDHLRSAARQRRRQQAALCILRHAQADLHGPLRLRLAVAECEQAARELRAWFGPQGFEPRYTVRNLEANVAHTLAVHGRSEAACHTLRRLYADAQAADRARSAPWLYFSVLNAHAHRALPVSPAFAAEYDRHLAELQEGTDAAAVWIAYATLADSAVRQGQLASAEASLAVLKSLLPSSQPIAALTWHDTSAELELAAGRPQAAAQHYRDGLEASLRLGDDFFAGVCRRGLDACDRASHELRHRRGGKLVRRRGVAEQPGA